MATSTVEERLASIEATLPHLGTKADLEQLRGQLGQLEHRLTLRLGGLMVIGFGVVIAMLRLWQ